MVLRLAVVGVVLTIGGVLNVSGLRMVTLPLGAVLLTGQRYPLAHAAEPAVGTSLTRRTHRPARESLWTPQPAGRDVR
jgi:hypothetical protein